MNIKGNLGHDHRFMFKSNPVLPFVVAVFSDEVVVIEKPSGQELTSIQSRLEDFRFRLIYFFHYSFKRIYSLFILLHTRIRKTL